MKKPELDYEIPDDDGWLEEEPPLEAMYAAALKERARKSPITEIALADFFEKQEKRALRMHRYEQEARRDPKGYQIYKAQDAERQRLEDEAYRQWCENER